jgi:type IV pilus assembly protein PilB
MKPQHFTGDLLVKNGVVDAAGLARAIAAQSTRPATLGRTLAELGLADESVVAKTIASALHLEHFVADPPAIDSTLARLLPMEFCRKHGAFVLGLEGNRLRVAVTDPLDYSLVQDAEFRTGKKVSVVVVTQTWIERALDSQRASQRPTSFDMLRKIEPAGEVEAVRDEYDLIDPETLLKDTNLPPVVRLVNMILSEAAKAGASDVHIEPQATMVQVRQRIDGLLREVLTIPHHLQDQTISRLKIISGMDIAERRKPQDGRSRLRFEGRRIDLRVSTLPTQFGEKVVIRLLNPEAAVRGLDQLGFSPEDLQLVRGFVARPQGMILVTGPTGSGKTSTLYSALCAIKSPTNNIITLEDPIEFQVPGVSQMQINVRAGVTFASGLRSILRQDPNIILVGEIRDDETAEVALQAAQTGHLLFSTLHTNDAPSTLTRLFDLGVQPFLVASSLIGILAQRLVRQPCAACAVAQAPPSEVVEKVGGPSRLPADGRWVSGRGCERCGGSGFKGRIAIHEVLQVTEEIRSLIASRAPEPDIKRAARRTGMRTLLEDGIQKAARGLTTLEEVVRVVPLDESAAPAAEPEPVPVEVAAPPPMEPSASEPESGARRRVLVVEDSPTISSVVKYYLEIEGFEVLVAEDGLRGLECAFRERPDLIVSDVNMPGMDGVTMVKALRQDARTRHIRVLMLTSESSVERETEGLNAGADDYLLKPVEPRRLAARVKAVLGRAPVGVA